MVAVITPVQSDPFARLCIICRITGRDRPMPGKHRRPSAGMKQYEYYCDDHEVMAVK